jgi:hypothetical protein
MNDYDELMKQFGKEYADDFMSLDRKGNAIITNDKFIAFMKKHIPDIFPLDEKEWRKKWKRRESSE